MAAGDPLLSADGDRILDENGNVILSDGAGDDCCCDPCLSSECASAVECNFCVCDTPQTWTAVVSGLSAACTLSCNPLRRVMATGTLNGTFTLTQASGGGDCNWDSGALSVTVRTYTDSGCTTVDQTYTNCVWRLRFFTSGGVGYASFNLVVTPATVPNSEMAFGRIDVSGTDPCHSGIDIDIDGNGNSCSNSLFGVTAGSVTLTPCS